MAFYLNVKCARLSKGNILSCHAQLKSRQEATGAAPKKQTLLPGAVGEKAERAGGSITRGVHKMLTFIGAEDGTAAEEEAITDALCDIVCDLARRAVATFGYFCEVKDLFGQGLFSVALVQNLKVDNSRSGFCYLPTGIASMMWGTCGMDVHGEHVDGRGFDHGTSRCGFTLPIAMEHVAELTQRLATTTFEGCHLDLKVTAVSPEKERQWLFDQDSKSFTNVQLPGLDLGQAALVYSAPDEPEGADQGARHRGRDEEDGPPYDDYYYADDM